MFQRLAPALAQRSLPSFEDGLPAAVVRAADATLASGGAATKTTDSATRRVISVRFDRPAGPALEALAGLRGAVCAGPDEWVWTPDPTDDVALDGRPYSNNLYLLTRAS